MEKINEALELYKGVAEDIINSMFEEYLENIGINFGEYVLKISVEIKNDKNNAGKYSNCHPVLRHGILPIVKSGNWIDPVSSAG